MQEIIVIKRNNQEEEPEEVKVYAKKETDSYEKYA